MLAKRRNTTVKSPAEENAVIQYYLIGFTGNMGICYIGIIQGSYSILPYQPQVRVWGPARGVPFKLPRCLLKWKFKQGSGFGV